MSADVPVRRSPHFIRPDHRRTVVRTFMPGDSPSAIEAEQTRAQRIIARVLSLPEDDLSVEYSRLPTVLCGRHRELEKVFLQRYENARELLGGGFSSSGTRAKLKGLSEGDIILSINQQPVRSAQDGLGLIAAARKAGAQASVAAGQARLGASAVSRHRVDGALLIVRRAGEQVPGTSLRLECWTMRPTVPPLQRGSDLPIDPPTECQRAMPPLAPHFRRSGSWNRRKWDES